MLLALPLDLLEQIALELAVGTAVGPPSGLIPLLLTCKKLNADLGMAHNKHVYFRIYSSQFDTTAHRRRFGRGAHNSLVVSRQLKRTWASLIRLRRGDLDSDTLHDDLWEAFCLVTENDGKNIAQLEWAGVPALAERYMHEKLWEGTEHGWPCDTPTSALAVWLFWGTMSATRLLAFTPEQREEIIRLVLPFVVVGFKYTAFFAPDNAYDLPLSPGLPPVDLVSQTNAHGEFPVFRSYEDEVYETQRFGVRLDVVMPPVVSAAKLIYFSLRETIPIYVPPNLPANRAEAIAQGQMRGQTQEDLNEVNTNRSTPFVPAGEWNFLQSLTPAQRAREQEGTRVRGLLAASAAWDDDFERIMWCWSPWSCPREKGPVFTPGSLAGLWQGRLLIPDVNGYLGLVTEAEFPEEFGETAPFMSTWPAFMRLTEHHALQNKVPFPVNNADHLDHGVWNAWVPPECRFSFERDSLTVIHPDGTRYFHETYVEGKPNSHDPDTCPRCNASDSEAGMSEGGYASDGGEQEGGERELTHADFEVEFAEAGLGRETATPVEDSDDEWDNSLALPESTCSGIIDIMITGETDPNHGMAWGHFKIFGRVRAWDGLVALVRAPNEPGRPRWVFRGYLHYGKALVGAWRGMTNIPGQARAVPWEGPFVFNRRDEAAPA